MLKLTELWMPQAAQGHDQEMSLALVRQWMETEEDFLLTLQETVLHRVQEMGLEVEDAQELLADEIPGEYPEWTLDSLEELAEVLSGVLQLRTLAESKELMEGQQVRIPIGRETAPLDALKGLQELVSEILSNQGIHLSGQYALSQGAILTGLMWGAMTALMIAIGDKETDTRKKRR